MTSFRPLLREAKTRFYESYAGRLVDLRLTKPVFSFTFDDVPQAARFNALPILERADVSATFYISTYLGDPERAQSPEGLSGQYFTADDIRAVHEAGHQIACHTYTHYSLYQGTARGLMRDAEQNRKVLCQLLCGASIQHFSYPYGEVSFQAKRLLQADYQTMRSTRPGINCGTVDLSLLRAEPIFHSSFSKEHVREIVRKTVLERGWLIFFTHSVDRVPEAWGCIPDELEWVVQQCCLAGGEILTVGEAYERVRGG